MLHDAPIPNSLCMASLPHTNEHGDANRTTLWDKGLRKTSRKPLGGLLGALLVRTQDGNTPRSAVERTIRALLVHNRPGQDARNAFLTSRRTRPTAQIAPTRARFCTCEPRGDDRSFTSTRARPPSTHLAGVLQNGRLQFCTCELLPCTGSSRVQNRSHVTTQNPS